jgi:hypothetical protein
MGKSPTSSMRATMMPRTSPTRLARPIFAAPGVSKARPADATTMPLAESSANRPASKRLCCGIVDQAAERALHSDSSARRIASGRNGCARGNRDRGSTAMSPTATMVRRGAIPSGARKPRGGRSSAAADSRWWSAILRVKLNSGRGRDAPSLPPRPRDKPSYRIDLHPILSRTGTDRTAKCGSRM